MVLPSLVGYFLHSKLPYKLVEPIARRLWGNKGLSKVFLHDKGYYIFKFQSIADKDNVLASGPWHFASKLIILVPWKEGSEFTKDVCRKIPMWVKFSNVPLSYLNSDGISFLASGIGKPLFVDEVTSNLEPMHFARVCIEITADFSFPSSIDVTVFDEDSAEEIVVSVDVEYQSKPPTCPGCKVFGHSPVKCPNSSFKWVPKVGVSEGSVGPLGEGPGVVPIAEGAIHEKEPSKELFLMSGSVDHKLPNQDWVTVSRGAKSKLK